MSRFKLLATISAIFLLAAACNKPVVQQQQTSSAGEIENWKIYADAQNGFELKYPAGWNIKTLNAGSVQIINPTRTVKDGEDVLVESFLVFVRKNEATCEAKNWEIGAGPMYYKEACIPGNQKIKFSMAAIDESGKSVQEKILSTFKFTR